ncbi:MAG: outer membrane protein transport protein, partial [Candidatus Latescibacterota bacterium]
MSLRSPLKWFLLLAAPIVMGGYFSQAQEMVVDNEAGVGGRAMGMGGAYTSVANDISAVYYNPAGLAQIRRIEWNLGVSMVQAKEASLLSSSRGQPASGKASGTVTNTSISSFGGVLPIPTYRGSLVFAFAYNRVKDFNSDFRVDGYSDSWDGSLQAKSVDTGSLDQWSFAGAVDVSSNVSLGASLDYYRGDHTLNQKSVYWSESDNYGEMYYSGYTDEIRALSLHTGMLLHTNKNIRLGVTLKLPLKYTIKSDYFDNWYARNNTAFTLAEHVLSSTADSSEAYSDAFSYYVKSPLEMNIGLSWVFKGVTLSGDVNFLDWSQATTDLREPEYLYRNTMNWRVGAETAIPVVNAFFRAGYASMPDPYTGYVYLDNPAKTEITEKN